MRIIFMGTPEFAVASLETLVENKTEIVGVITAPDKPKGRGKVLQGTPVKDFAESKGLNILQPTNLKSEYFLEELKELRADLQIVVAFRMLPAVVWNMPKFGTFNLHGSLLPQYRGAAPINWAIINGEKETGVTTFFLKHKIDTGNVILQEKELINPEDTAADLYERLMTKGAELVLKTLEVIKANDYTLTVQNEIESVKAAPKIFKETCEIDWSKSAQEVYNFVRGLSPYPASWVTLHGKKFKIYKVSIEKASDLSIGEIFSDNRTFVKVGTSTQNISISELQPNGKKRMHVEDYLRGNKIQSQGDSPIG